jgi:hypothetical protein
MLKSYAAAFVLAAFVGVPAFAQGDARGIYVEGEKTGKIGLKFGVALVRDGRPTKVPIDYAFRSGDQLKFEFDANRDCYVYVLHRTVEGEKVERYAGFRGMEVIQEEDRRDRRRDSYELLFPSAAAGGNNFIQKHRPVSIPGASRNFRMDSHPGYEKLIVVASTKPLTDLDGYFDMSTGRLRGGDVLGDLTHSLLGLEENTIVATRGMDVVDGYAGARTASKALVVVVDLRHVRD